MAEQLEKDIQRYKNIWKEVSQGGLKKKLPTLNKAGYLTTLTKEIEKSFQTTGQSALAKQLSTIHSVTRQLHYLRDILSITEKPILTLRGLRDVIK
jgi:hypothetical protein